MTYKFFKGTSDTVQTDCILRISDKDLIPFDEGNIDYQVYLKWLNGEDPYTEKGTPDPAD